MASPWPFPRVSDLGPFGPSCLLEKYWVKFCNPRQTELVHVSNVLTTSNKELKLSFNIYIFKVIVIKCTTFKLCDHLCFYKNWCSQICLTILVIIQMSYNNKLFFIWKLTWPGRHSSVLLWWPTRRMKKSSPFFPLFSMEAVNFLV